VSIAHNLTIVTGNDKDFRRPGLKVFGTLKDRREVIAATRCGRQPPREDARFLRPIFLPKSTLLPYFDRTALKIKLRAISRRSTVATPLASCTLAIKAVPNAPRNAVVGWLGDALKVKVHAPALEGRANDEL
jgi:hypothetical protein